MILSVIFLTLGLLKINRAVIFQHWYYWALYLLTLNEIYVSLVEYCYVLWACMEWPTKYQVNMRPNHTQQPRPPYSRLYPSIHILYIFPAARTIGWSKHHGKGHVPARASCQWLQLEGQTSLAIPATSTLIIGHRIQILEQVHAEWASSTVLRQGSWCLVLPIPRTL